MNLNELVNLKEIKIKQRNEMLQSVEQITKELEALDTVLSMLQKTDVGINITPIQHPTTTIEQSQAEGYGSLTKNVKRAISQFPGIWDKNDIMASIGKVDDGSLAGCFNRLIKQRYIEIVQKGSGRRPATYRKINNVTIFNKKE
ncbi:MAG: hypothetical protein JW787_18130 [Sedimentisphaerales bacterium]|nr:hypothetical protein [Sedimentisphaerales bacterium]